MTFRRLIRFLHLSHLDDDFSHSSIAVSKPDPEPDGNEGAAEGENDRAEGQKVHHGCVDPRATVHPQTQRHEHERQNSGWDGHDDAGKQTPQKKIITKDSQIKQCSSYLYFISMFYALSIIHNAEKMKTQYMQKNQQKYFSKIHKYFQTLS